MGQSIDAVGTIGAGNIGGILGAIWSDGGLDVMLSSRHPDQIDAPEGVAVGTILEAAEYGDAVLLAVPFAATAEFDGEVQEALEGRLVIDADNPFEHRDGDVAAGAKEVGSGVWTASQLPGARVVKAFNTVHYQTMPKAARGEVSIGVPYAADDEEDGDLVAELIRAAGMEPVYAGPLEHSALFELGTPLWNSGASAEEVSEQLESAD